MDDAITNTSFTPSNATSHTSSSFPTTGKNNNINYTPNLGIPLHPVSDVEIAEITKIR